MALTDTAIRNAKPAETVKLFDERGLVSRSFAFRGEVVAAEVPLRRQGKAAVAWRLSRCEFERSAHRRDESAQAAGQWHRSGAKTARARNRRVADRAANSFEVCGAGMVCKAVARLGGNACLQDHPANGEGCLSVARRQACRGHHRAGTAELCCAGLKAGGAGYRAPGAPELRADIPLWHRNRSLRAGPRPGLAWRAGRLPNQHFASITEPAASASYCAPLMAFRGTLVVQCALKLAPLSSCGLANWARRMGAVRPSRKTNGAIS